MVTFLIDAGTTNVRISLLDAERQVLDTVRSEAGVRHTAIDGNNHKLCQTIHDGIADLMAKHSLKAEDVGCCIAYGMITSNLGLVEIPHLPAPVSFRQFQQAVVTRDFPQIAPFPIRFIPGVKNFDAPVTLENADAMDMMRGEETECIGLCRLLKLDRPAVIVLPGSHNKFIAVDEHGSIRSCMTSISGELLSALTRNTILADAVDSAFASAEEYDREMVLAGAKACASGLGRASFTARILRTLGGFDAARLRSFLLGVVFSLDLQALEQADYLSSKPVVYIAGKAPVSQALYDLMDARGLQAELVPDALQKRMGIAGALDIAGI